MDQEPSYTRAKGNNSGFWLLKGPDILVEDMENLIFEAGNRKQYLFVVIGKPFYVSPEWDATHPGGISGEYDYASSYPIPANLVGNLLDEYAEDTAEDFFNAYLDSEETLKGWEDIREIKIVDQDKWKNTYND
jgi:hypothetical protein